MIWKCTSCGYEMELEEAEECPKCGSVMIRIDDDYDNEDMDDDGGIY